MASFISNRCLRDSSPSPPRVARRISKAAIDVGLL